MQNGALGRDAVIRDADPVIPSQVLGRDCLPALTFTAVFDTL